MVAAADRLSFAGRWFCIGELIDTCAWRSIPLEYFSPTPHPTGSVPYWEPRQGPSGLPDATSSCPGRNLQCRRSPLVSPEHLGRLEHAAAFPSDVPVRKAARGGSVAAAGTGPSVHKSGHDSAAGDRATRGASRAARTTTGRKRAGCSTSGAGASVRHSWDSRKVSSQ